MTVSTGSRLGFYEILSPLGAGGMGEVYRARDTRLARDVAVKVLPEELASDPERLRRFEREARAASALSHPNIVTIFEVAKADQTSFIAMELVEGKTLRELAAGAALPFRKILSIAPQIAEGLAKAHAAGIVHRDLKPENVMVTADGIVKILDFGLAKLTHPQTDSGQTVPGSTVSAATRPGIAMGTVSYMSPEQASGHPVDYRSDQFSLGSMLYEMAAGKPAFRQPTTAQTLASIIEDEPEPIGRAAPKTPAPLRWVIERCLSKEPKGRYASTEDLARELADLRDHVSDLSSGSGVKIEPVRPRPRWRAPFLAGTTLLAGLAIGLLASRRMETEPPRYHRLTFRRGDIFSARFTPDGQSIIYSAVWEGKPMQLYSTRVDSTESTALPLPSAAVLSISSAGAMALGLQRHPEIPWGGGQTLAEVPIAGGAPREILDEVEYADWSPDGKNLAVVRRVGNQDRLEWPIGRVVHETSSGYLLQPRFSPDGASIAVVESTTTEFAEQSVILIGHNGEKKTLTKGWQYTFGLAWNPRTGEVWFSAREAERGVGNLALHAVSLSGRHRLISRASDSIVLQDISREGRVLLARAEFSQTTMFLPSGSTRAADLSWHGFNALADLSDDGKSVLLCDLQGETSAGAIYLRSTDGSAAVRLCEGADAALSADGKWVAAISSTRDRLTLLPTGAGPPRVLPGGSLGYRSVRFLPDGKGVAFSASASGRAPRGWIQDLGGGSPRPLTPEGVELGPISPDGKWIATSGPEGDLRLFPIAGGESRPILGARPDDRVIRWDASGTHLFMAVGALPVRVERLDLSTGLRKTWSEISLLDPAGVPGVDMLLTPDGRTCAYWYLRSLSALDVVDGLR